MSASSNKADEIHMAVEREVELGAPPSQDQMLNQALDALSCRLPIFAGVARPPLEWLLTGEGMLAVYDLLRTTSMDMVKIIDTGYRPVSVEIRSPGWGAIASGKTLPEAFACVAFKALHDPRCELNRPFQQPSTSNQE